MFSKFKVEKELVNGFEKFDGKKDYASIGEQLFSEYDRQLTDSFQRYLKPNGCVDAEKLSGDWFPEVKADIFISHSHKNKRAALCLAGYLKEHFGLVSFIDSTIWGNFKDLQKEIDKSALKEDGLTYSYQKRNQTTAYVHMLLSTALTKMMDNCEALFFLSTDQALKSQEPNITPSVWIYHELFTAKYLRQRNPERPIVESSEFSRGGTLGFQISREYQFDFKVDFEGFKPLGVSQFNEWCQARNRNQSSHPLDLLYAVFKRKRTSILLHDPKLGTTQEKK